MLTSDTLKAALTGVNLSRLSARCGFDRRTLQRVRDGENSPTLRSAEAIAQALRALAAEDGKPDPFPDLPLPLASATAGQQDTGGGPSDTGDGASEHDSGGGRDRGTDRSGIAAGAAPVKEAA